MTFGLYSKDLDVVKYTKLSNGELVSLRNRVIGDSDKEAWEALWQHGLRLVLKIVNHMFEKNVLQHLERDDAIAEGNLSIGPALLSWAPKKGPYATWIWIRIRGAILDAENRERLCGFIGSPTGDFEVVGYTQVAGGGDFLLTDLYEAGQTDDGDAFTEVFSREVLAALATLSQRERTYVYQVYVLGISLSDLARADGVSRQRINQILSLALNRLREALAV